jgi:Holliday junction resolvase RusA-like endonuclease
MTRIVSALEYRLVVPGKGVSFRSPDARDYRAAVLRAARAVLPATPYDQQVELRLDYFHVSARRFDMDNLAKCVMDALTGIAYTDDRFARLQTSAAYDLTHRVDIQGGPVDLVKPLRRYRDYLFLRIRIPRHRG